MKDLDLITGELQIRRQEVQNLAEALQICLEAKPRITDRQRRAMQAMINDALNAEAPGETDHELPLEEERELEQLDEQ